jgi:hypothetical protein
MKKRWAAHLRTLPRQHEVCRENIALSNKIFSFASVEDRIRIRELNATKLFGFRM